MLIFTALLCLSTIGTLAVPIEKAIEDPKGYLLPNNEVIPEDYNITIDVTKSFSNSPPKKFDGIVEITASTTKSIKSITLHAVSMNLTKPVLIEYVDLTPPTAIQKVNYTMDEAKQFLKLDVGQIDANRKIKITMFYEGKLYDDDMHGFYVSKYTEGNNT